MTAEERRALREGGAPEALVVKLEGHAGITTSTLAFRKAVSALRAQREFWEETLALEEAQERYAKKLDALKALAITQAENNQLKKELEATKKGLGRATARTAMAAHSED